MQTKTVIVTGASSGIGAGIAAAYLEQGHNVVGNARTANRLEAALQTFPKKGRFVAVAGDIGEYATSRQLVDTAIAEFGGIDILVNNAGIFQARSFTDYTTADLEGMLHTNLRGPFYLSQLAAVEMGKQGGGHIVMITAAIADQPLLEVPAAIPVLIKGGLNAMTKALALELAGKNILVNAVAPGMIVTPLHDPASHGFLNGMQPLGRTGSVQDVVDAVLYLTGGTFTTGVVLPVDGGLASGKW